MSAKLFGTDGIRGLANVYPMTGEVALQVGRAVGHVLHMHPEVCSKSSVPVGIRAIESHSAIRRARVVVGKDTRLANYMIENALVSGLCSMGVDAYLIGPLPTPGVAFVTQNMRADAGIMISASHNPYYDTGIKIFGSDGFKWPDAIESQIEAFVKKGHAHIQLPTESSLGKAFRIDDAIGRYLVALKAVFPKEIDLQGIRLIVDAAHGAAYKVAPLVFEELGAEVLCEGIDPSGLNINEHCGALHPQHVAAATLQYRADVGIALDGDGDRCILSDENGEVVDGDQIIGLCALHMAASGVLKNNLVVTTPMSNFGLEWALREHGIEMIRANVGDRYVVEAMRKHGAVLGGEQSGHVIFLDQATTGDGLLAALKVLEVMRKTGRKLSDLKKSIRLLPQSRHDIKVRKKEPLDSIPAVVKEIQHAQTALADRGRVFVRYSGTEQLARVMVEGEDLAQIQGLSLSIATSIEKALGPKAVG